jgi:hypothetical protein
VLAQVLKREIQGPAGAPGPPELVPVDPASLACKSLGARHRNGADSARAIEKMDQKGPDKDGAAKKLDRIIPDQ